MIRNTLFMLLILGFICSSVQAQDRDFGLGVIIGEPTGISGKLWTGRTTAVDGAVAWSFANESSMHLHGDLLFHNFGLAQVEKGKLAFYVGVGGRIKFEDENKIGVRFPLGMNYLFENTPIDFFLEIVPILDLAPSTDFDLNGAIGFRYFF